MGTTTTTAATATTTAPAVITPTPSPTASPIPPPAVAIDAAGDLYAAPPDVTTMPFGTLVRYQALSATAFRIMYVSGDQLDRPVAVTGTVHIPAGSPPTDGWPVISWAHGTTGTADACAPSKSPTPGGLADPLTNANIVAVSTDYVGLGGPGLHPYLDGPSEGRAVLDIVPAAAQLPGVRIGTDLTIWGHSQGGHSALFARQLAGTRLPGHRVVGTVAFAPPSNIGPVISLSLARGRSKAFGVMAVAAIAAAHPEANLGAILSPVAVAVTGATVDTECSSGIDRAFVNFKIDNALSADPLTVQPWADALVLDEPAMTPGSGPLLIIHARDDATVPAPLSEAIMQRTCLRGEPTQRWLVDSGGHSGIVEGDTLARAQAWTVERFAGTPANNDCG